ncbi:NlpC/P60 family protein [Cryptosporangium aurantiacum]|uniref:Cell wall-associated hydrolase, NlpC family n=1 Tax=Cryptosporangium aurantiacum TaxID=134849 RepID=A0A1M7RHD8_9ACTN|nr:NlpC/P60 family protein [Cryptosporangium aurantiacum]SHN45582.1 Cell wall-associated hydrolase, NlpC family [Cryptosporangium aurantiacum]
MAGAHRKPTPSFRRSSALFPSALAAIRNFDGLRAVRLSAAVGTALTLVAGSGPADAFGGTPARVVPARVAIDRPLVSVELPKGVAGPALPATSALRPEFHPAATPGRPAARHPAVGAKRPLAAGHPAGVNRPPSAGRPAVGVKRPLVGGNPAVGAGRGAAVGAQPAIGARQSLAAGHPIAGGRPVAPARPASRPRPVTDPVLAQIARESAAGEAVAERLTDAKITLGTLAAAHTTAESELAAARAVTADAESEAAAWARDSFIAEASRPTGLAADPRSAVLGRPKVGPALLALETAEAHERAAADAARRAGELLDVQRSRVDALRRDLAARGATLRRLRAARAAALAAAQRRRDAVEAALVRRHLRDAKGAAGKAAVSAVEFALAQRGKPYEWGAEGPQRFDCSGLVQTAYASADVTLPRTARPQYRASRPVSITALLPGDLLFFATDRADWDTIHHVGVYLGRGLMVHAPTTGDVVRIAPVWWSEFFAAGRVVPGRAGKRGDDRSRIAIRPERRAKPQATPSRPGATGSPSGSPSTSGSPEASGSPTGAARTSENPRAVRRKAGKARRSPHSPATERPKPTTHSDRG